MKKIITQTIVVAFTAGSLMLTTACGGGEDEAAAEADAADAASEAEGDGEEEEPGGEQPQIIGFSFKPPIWVAFFVFVRYSAKNAPALMRGR